MPATLLRFALLCLAVVAACPASAGAWSHPRSGGLGHQTLRGGPGADYLRGAEGPDTVNGNGGGDLLTGDTGPDIISGGSGSDTINGGAGNDRMRGGTGNDIVSGGFGADRIDGGPGDDALVGDNDSDTIHGGDGNDVLHGGSGIDNLYGEGGDDRIFADSGAGEILGGDGNDTIIVDGATRSTVNCGPGDDRLYVSIDADATEDYAGGLKIFGFPGCEAVFLTDALGDPNKGVTYLARDRGGDFDGTAGDDTLLGGPGADALQGGAGNDVLWGLRQPDVKSAARDYLIAGSGDDTVYGGPGPQRIDGGPGDDFLESGIGNGTINGGSGDDTIRLRGGGETKIDAGPGNDTIYASGTARAKITCGPGHDVAHADSGDRVARDCERIIGGAKRSKAKLRTTYADAIRSTSGLVHWFRLGEAAPLGYNVSLVDQVSTAAGSYYGELGAPGVTDDGDTAFQSNTSYYVGDPSVSLGIYDDVLHHEFTFEGWYRATDSSTQRGLLSDAPYGSNQGIFLVRETDGSLHAIILSGTGTSLNIDLRTPPLDLAAESWHHIALTRADDRVAIYVDGVLRAETAATPIPFPIQNYGVGVGARVGTYKGWEGGIDEIAIYDRALDAATIDGHFRAGDEGMAPVARADPDVGPLQPRDGVIHLKADEAGTSFRCALDGAGFTPCTADYPLVDVPDGQHQLRVLATSRTGVAQQTPTVLGFRVDASLPSTILALRLAPDGDGRAIVTFGSDSAVGFECRFAHSTFGPTLDFTPCSAPMDVTPGSIMEVRAVDSAGNRDPTPAFAQVPPAGIGFNYGPLLPTFAGSRAEARLSGEFSFGANFQCRLDGHAWAACSTDFRLPLLDPGVHTLQVRQPVAGGAIATTAPMAWRVAPRPGDVAIAGLQTDLAVERGARLLRRAPRVRFALSHQAAVRIDVLKRGRKPVISVTADGRIGANIAKLPARKLNGLPEGRYTVRLAARGASGKRAQQELPLAIVPPLR
jgi:hypothetical protein